MAIAFIFEMPLNRRTSISVSFLFENQVTCFFLEMPHFELLKNLEMPRFSEPDGKHGAFQRFRTIESGAFRGKGNSEINANSIT